VIQQFFIDNVAKMGEDAGIMAKTRKDDFGKL